MSDNTVRTMSGYFRPGEYPVNDIYASIQGEGVKTGTPMVFLRLQGCDVGCPWCDTKETWTVDPLQKARSIKDVLGKSPVWTMQKAEKIAWHIARNFPNFEWILLTGGEPSRYDLAPLVDQLHEAGYKVAIETSGTALGFLRAGVDWVCVSPKIGMPGGLDVHPDAVAAAHEIKWVLGKELDLARLEEFKDKYAFSPHCVISLQPVSQSPKATKIAITACLERGYHLSIQVHKYIEVA